MSPLETLPGPASCAVFDLRVAVLAPELERRTAVLSRTLSVWQDDGLFTSMDENLPEGELFEWGAAILAICASNPIDTLGGSHVSQCRTFVAAAETIHSLAAGFSFRARLRQLSHR